MNIGIVVPGFSASESDWCIPALVSLVRELAKTHRVRVFALRYPERTGTYPVFSADVHALGGGMARGARRLPLVLRAMGAIRREHGREPFDVLHAFWIDEPGFIATLSARLLGVPSVVTLLGGELVSLPEIGYGGRRSRLNRLFAGVALREASRVTVGSRYLRDLCPPRKEPMMLPIGVDEKRFTPGKGRNDLLAGGRKLLHVGSLVPVKDQPTLLRAFARVREAFPDACLHLVGDGPREAALRELVSALSVEDHVVFHGSVPHHELPAYYRSADLAVMSSLHEGQEWVTQEAAACGRTTVGTKVGVMADLEPATTTVAPRDHIALSRAVVDALSDPRRLHQRHLDARRLVVERYSLSRTTAALTSLYDELRDSAS